MLFCVLCDNKAEYNYSGSRFPMYCKDHKRERMIPVRMNIQRKKIFKSLSFASGTSCLICDLDFSTSHLCNKCSVLVNPAEKLALKYVMHNLNREFNLFEEDHYNVITANFKGNPKVKLLDLEYTFQVDKVVLVNFNLDLNNINTLEQSLSTGLQCLEELIQGKITKSKLINV